MDKKQLFKYIWKDEVPREILFSCKKGKTTKEVLHSMYAYYQKKRYDFTTAMVEGLTAINLSNLKKIEAVEFEEGKWFTTEIAEELLDKYF